MTATHPQTVLLPATERLTEINTRLWRVTAATRDLLGTDPGGTHRDPEEAGACLDRIEPLLGDCRHEQARLEATIAALRTGLGARSACRSPAEDLAVGRDAPAAPPPTAVPTLRAFALPVAPPPTAVPTLPAFELPVAPLDVPDRITKRDYNYFGALNEALQELAEHRLPPESDAAR